MRIVNPRAPSSSAMEDKLSDIAGAECELSDALDSVKIAQDRLCSHEYTEGLLNLRDAVNAAKDALATLEAALPALDRWSDAECDY